MVVHTYASQLYSLAYEIINTRFNLTHVKLTGGVRHGPTLDIIEGERISGSVSNRINHILLLTVNHSDCPQSALL
jgi:hypothetical protein